MEWIDLYVKIKIFSWLLVVVIFVLTLVVEWVISVIESLRTKRAADRRPPVQEKIVTADEKWVEKVIKRHASR